MMIPPASVPRRLPGLRPEGREVGRDDDAGHDLDAGLPEGVDLRGEVVGQVLGAARVLEPVAELREPRREARDRVAPSGAVAVVGEEPARRPVGPEVPPHVGEDRDDVLEPPENVDGVVEGLPRGRVARIALLADEPGLPGRHGRDDGDAFVLAGGRDRVRRLGRRGREHQVDLVVDDQLLRDLGGAVEVLPPEPERLQGERRARGRRQAVPSRARRRAAEDGGHRGGEIGHRGLVRGDGVRQDDRVRLGMGQPEGPAEHVAELVVQRLARLLDSLSRRSTRHQTDRLWRREAGRDAGAAALSVRAPRPRGPRQPPRNTAAGR